MIPCVVFLQCGGYGPDVMKPYLTIVLNNGGWKVRNISLSLLLLTSFQAPGLSMLGVHPSGYGSRAASRERLSLGFGPDCPDYAQIAVAASGNTAWGRRVAGDTSMDGLGGIPQIFVPGRGLSTHGGPVLEGTMVSSLCIVYLSESEKYRSKMTLCV